LLSVGTAQVQDYYPMSGNYPPDVSTEPHLVTWGGRRQSVAPAVRSNPRGATLRPPSQSSVIILPACSRALDIIVPIYKNAALVRICVDSLLEHIAEIGTHCPRLILINDSPGDAEVEALLAGYEVDVADLTALRNSRNLGFVGAVNRGLAQAQRDVHDVLLVNSDTQTFPGTLAQLLRAAYSDPQIGFACPRSNNASICSLPHFFGGSPPTPAESYRRWLEISRTMPAFHFAPTAVGFYLFIAHAVLADHGGLRSDFGIGYEEENDLVMRAGRLGTRAVIANHSFAYHAGSASFNLTDLDLNTHKHQNLVKLNGFHPEFLPLVRRYEDSPHYRAERLMTGLIPDREERTKIAFDLTGMGQHYNGTNEQAVAVLRSMAKRQCHRIRLTAIASAESFRCHGLDEVEGLHREEPESPGVHGIAVRMSQPFDLHHINTLEALAPINVFAMLDTIAEDCGPLALIGNFLELWDHIAEHANGLLFISQFSERTYCNRHPAAWALPRWTSLLPTRLSSYAKQQPGSQRTHVLVLGNHFAHKGADTAARAIARAFPTLRIVALGSETLQAANLTGYRSGLLDPAFVDGLFTDASVVVLPSHIEGFGFGFMHALAAGRPIVARRIPATEEILASLDDVEGVFQFDHDAGLLQVFALALRASESRAKDSRGNTWDDWADGLTDFCLSLAARDDVFRRLAGRIGAGDRLRRGARGDALLREAHHPLPDQPAATLAAPSDAKAIELDSLLALDGRDFVEHAYATLLRRPADDGGLRAYLTQLEQGTPKIEILQTLADSAEGLSRDVKLRGLDVMTLAHRNPRRPLLRRIFGT
jgi:GT2 family glycosyltransferase